MATSRLSRQNVNFTELPENNTRFVDQTKMDYLTVTFVIETMAAGNALIQWTKLMRRKSSYLVNDAGHLQDDEEETETQPLLSVADVIEDINDPQDLFIIKQRIEMGQMASMFFNKIGLNLFYIALCIYLFGDLAIYAAAIPKSLRDVVCTWDGHQNNSHSGFEPLNRTLNDDDLCWNGSELSRINAYRIFVVVVSLLLGPFVFFNVQKTKYLQLVTTFLRWFAFAIMIVLSVLRLSAGKGQGHPPVAVFEGLPNLFGVCIYSFMCHHSLPSLVTPIKNKSKINSLFAADYLLIMGFYGLLSFTGIFTFNELKDIYTLNFEHDANDPNPITTIQFFQYFLALFPVFVLSSNFPIIGITLRNNLKSLFFREDRPFSWGVDRIVFPLVAVVPPVIAAIATSNVTVLVSITGSYAGAAVQYVIPAFLVYCARKKCKAIIGEEVINKHMSPFKNKLWVFFVLLWAVVCVIFVTVNHIVSRSI